MMREATLPLLLGSWDKRVAQTAASPADFGEFSFRPCTTSRDKAIEERALPLGAYRDAHPYSVVLESQTGSSGLRGRCPNKRERTSRRPLWYALSRFSCCAERVRSRMSVRR